MDYILNFVDEDKKIKQILDEGLISKKIYTKNLELKKEKSKKEEKIANFLVDKLSTKGIIYITKQTTKGDLKNPNSDDYKKLYKNFKEYFINGINQRNKFLKSSDVPLKKGKMASTSKLTNLNRQVTDKIAKTEYNNTITDTDSNYEIEKLKKLENVKVVKKQLDMSVWLSETFPLKLNHFIPLIHILSYFSSDFSELKSTLCSNLLPFQSFPLKISFPLGLTFYALLQVTSFNKSVTDPFIFELNYEKSFTEEDENFYNLTNTQPNKSILDEKYAKDFYEKYYLERKQDENNSVDDSSFFQNDKIREIFLNNSDEEKKQNESGKKICLKSEKTSKMGLFINSPNEEELKSKEEKNKANRNRKYNNIPSLNKQDFLEKDEIIPSEKDNTRREHFKLKIPYTPTPKKIKLIEYDLEQFKKSEGQDNDSDESQRTLKCTFKPKLMKNYKNFFKYQSNLDLEIISVESNLVKVDKIEKPRIDKKSSEGYKKDFCIIF